MGRVFNTASDTDINIINQALDLIHAKNIATTGAGMTTEEEQKAANIYEDTRDLLLTEFAWNFAMNSATILNVASAGAGNTIPDNYSFKSALPTDCLRILQVRNYLGKWMRYQKDYLLCDINTNLDPLEIRYIKQVTDASLFDPNFREVLIIKLASKLAPPVSDKAQAAQNYYAMEQREVAKAMRLHAVEEAEYEDENTHEDQSVWVTEGR
jgi:hypothetical protein